MFVFVVVVVSAVNIVVAAAYFFLLIVHVPYYFDGVIIKIIAVTSNINLRYVACTIIVMINANI